MLGIISDIHGNLPALEAVLSQLRQRGASEFVCLGDVCGYYPWINECLDLVRECCALCLMGNHDYYLALGARCARSESVNRCIAFQRSQVREEHLVWLRTLKSRGEVRGISCVHGGWHDPLDEYLSVEDLEDLDTGTAYACSGHTHKALLWKRAGFNYCNPGSVGQPRDGDPRAAAALFDGRCFEIVRSDYDWCLVQEKMKECGFEERYTAGLPYGRGIGQGKPSVV